MSGLEFTPRRVKRWVGGAHVACSGLAGLSSSRERKRATTVQGKRVEAGCGRAPGKSFRIQGAAPRFSRPWRACRGGVTDLDSLRNSFRVEICGIRNYLNCLKLGACGSILLNMRNVHSQRTHSSRTGHLHTDTLPKIIIIIKS